MIERLALENFRNHESIYIESDSSCVIICGRNGSGKTSIVEAISLINAGAGFRAGSLDEITRYLDPSREEYDRKDEAEILDMAPSIRATIDKDAGKQTSWRCRFEFATDVLDDTNIESELLIEMNESKKNLLLNGKRVTSEYLARRLKVVIFSPLLDGLFIDSPAVRRRFFSHIVYSVYSQYLGYYRQYDHAMQSRLMLLKQGNLNNEWLNQLENNLAYLSIMISMLRIKVGEYIQSSMDELNSDLKLMSICKVIDLIKSRYSPNKYENSAEIDDRIFHSMLQTLDDFCSIANRSNSHQLIETIQLIDKVNDANIKESIAELKRIFYENRRIDFIQKRTSFGVHRFDFLCQFRGRNIRFCSTGEQKLGLYNLIFAHCGILHKLNIKAIIILDDLFSHFDIQKRESVIDILSQSQFQTWITIHDSSDIERIQNAMHLRNINPAKIVML